jgi:hypothetical protein
MKKFISLFILALAFYAVTFAQERTVNLNAGLPLDLKVTQWYAYNGITADRLIPTTRDTIDYVLQLKNQTAGPLHFYALVTLSPVSGADTTVAITVQQKKFAGETYSDLIASALTAAITAETKVVKTSLGVTSEVTETVAAATDYFNDEITTNTDTTIVAARTITKVVNTLLYPGYLKFRLILQGNDSVGTGIQVKRIEIKFYN